MNHKALFSENGQEWHDGPAIQWVPDDTVTKIVIGKPTKSDSKRDLISLAPALPENLAELYPAITHLYLWQIENLANLPRLPETLECLDARDCPKLTSLTNLPANLETLVLERCEKLLINASTRRHHFPKLLDLSLAGSGQVDQAWVRSVLQSASSLKKADLSACQQIERITNWPSVLVDIRMNDCTCLQSLPPWPPNLRRVELRNATRISRVPNFPSQIDYVDLAGTRSLESLPRDRGLPRTLYLYRSGVLEPPASEHGSEDKENVAADVADYFSDMQLTGKGDVRRCKLLMAMPGRHAWR